MRTWGRLPAHRTLSYAYKLCDSSDVYWLLNFSATNGGLENILAFTIPLKRAILTTYHMHAWYVWIGDCCCSTNVLLFRNLVVYACIQMYSIEWASLTVKEDTGCNGISLHNIQAIIARHSHTWISSCKWQLFATQAIFTNANSNEAGCYEQTKLADCLDQVSARAAAQRPHM